MITLVQNTTASTPSGASLVVTPGSSPIDGNSEYLLIYSSGAVTVSSVAQTGATWTSAVHLTDGGINLDIYHAENILGASTTITITFSGTAGPGMANYAEFSGIIKSSSLDQTASNSGSSTTVDSGTTSTTTKNSELWLAALTAVTSSIGAPSNGFSNINSVTTLGTFTTALEYKVVNTTGAANTSATISSAIWDGAIATFIGASPTNQSIFKVGGGIHTHAGHNLLNIN